MTHPSQRKRPEGVRPPCPQNQGDACLSEFALLQLREMGEEMGEEVVTECEGCVARLEALRQRQTAFAQSAPPLVLSNRTPSASNAPGMAGRVSHWMTQTAGALRNPQAWLSPG